MGCDAPDAVPLGRLVHVKGVARAEGRVTDDQTGVSMNALVLARTVSMYQWVESCTYDDRRPTAFGRDMHVDDELRRATLRRVLQGRVVRWSRCTYTKAWKDEEQTIRPDRVDRYGNPPFPFETGTHRFVPMRWALGKL